MMILYRLCLLLSGQGSNIRRLAIQHERRSAIIATEGADSKGTQYSQAGLNRIVKVPQLSLDGQAFECVFQYLFIQITVLK